ncbi:hypothetical protein J7T55_005915 [Diaporthe amygdali]|uniref:uncharacterized protein n=1 Tax=Phomopsis amygdali TaxID=1214568 RepID=UPI0022FF225C|nr:uncharacterized protein J7T55_005915 [Diaporthe amygdali]KAJ0124576.1 hypothetical protein J7T55_005915 [Diaporthe amygdali]
MEEENHISQPADSVEKAADQCEAQNIPDKEDADTTAVPETAEKDDIPAVDPENSTNTTTDATTESDSTKDTLGQDEPQPNAEDSLEDDSHISLRGEPEFDSHEEPPAVEEPTHEARSEADHDKDEASPDAIAEEQQSHDTEEPTLDSELDESHEESQLENPSDDAETQDGTELSSRRGSDASNLERRHSVRTEALIQAAARAVVSMRDQNEHDATQEEEDSADESELSSTTHETEDPDETIHGDVDQDGPSRPESSASRSVHSSEGDGADNSTEDDVFSDRSPRTSIHSSDEHFDGDSVEAMTEKGDQSPYVRSRVASGVSTSGASVISEQSRLSRYEKEDFIPTSRSNRPAFRSPSSVRAMQMSSPTPSNYSSPTRSKRQHVLPTISRLGSPSVSGQYPPRGRSTPTRFKRPEPAPLVLLHVTLLPLRWAYGEVVNYFEGKKVPPVSFSSEGIKNLRAAWRQLQDRLGDTEMERGILLPHPQNDYEVLEERLLEALELPLRRRARILECGHYLGPSNEMTPSSDIEDDSEDTSDVDDSEASGRREKRHWCKTCRGDIKYEELGSERVFRIKVYASNGLMSPGAWEACWKEMERVDIEVEPITGSPIQHELSKLGATFDQEHQQRLDQESEDQERLRFEEEQRLQMEEERRQQLEIERQQLEAQRQEFEEERRRSLEESQKKLEEERRLAEKEQRERIEEERRQQFEEERQLLDAQRREFEEQRQELDNQRKMIEQEQRQHLEEARRQELEEEHRLLDEQRQQLEEARQQFEVERRQRLEEEELRRLQREEDEQKQMSSARSISRSSFVEDDLASPALETASSTDVDGRRRDSERLREIYGNHSRTLSETTATNSSPAIHIHVDSGRQREEEQNSRQLATIPAPRDTEVQPSRVHADPPHSEAFISTPTPASPSEQAYQRREGRRRSLDSASLAELVGESIRILLQDPKNVAIGVLVVLIAMLAGQFAKRDDHGVELYKPQQHHHQYQHHQLDNREPVGQVIMNTPAVQRIETMPPPPVAETVYKTVTESPSSSPSPLVETIYKTVIESSHTPSSSQHTETVYQTVIQPPVQEKSTPIVETIYTTVIESLAQPHAQSANAALENARESTPSRADPSIDLNPLSSISGGESGISASPPTPVSEFGFVASSPLSTAERDLAPESYSNEDTLKANISEEALVDTEIEQIIATIFNPTCYLNKETPNSDPRPLDSLDPEIPTTQPAYPEHEEDSITIENEYDEVDNGPVVEMPSLYSRSTPSSSTAGAATDQQTTVRVAETITETVIVTATRTSFQQALSATVNAGVVEA